MGRSVSSLVDDALAIAPVRVITIALFSARTSKADALMVPTVLIVARASSLRLMTDTAPAAPKPVVAGGTLAGGASPRRSAAAIASVLVAVSFETTAAASDRATRLPEFTASTLTGPAAESATPLSVRGVSVGGSPWTPTMACVSRDTILTAIERPNPVFWPSKTPPAMV